jgi:hypothetical protein
MPRAGDPANLQDPNYCGAVSSPHSVLDRFERVPGPTLYAALDHHFHGSRAGNSTTFDGGILLSSIVLRRP